MHRPATQAHTHTRDYFSIAARQKAAKRNKTDIDATRKREEEEKNENEHRTEEGTKIASTPAGPLAER